MPANGKNSGWKATQSSPGIEFGGFYHGNGTTVLSVMHGDAWRSNRGQVNMKKMFADLLPDIASFYTSRLKGKPAYDWGYEFLYNPEAACRKETKILLMTINPQAGERQVIVDTPCPARHAFWCGTFKIQHQLHSLFQELQRIVAPSSTDAVQDFASQHVIASSAVPFRTHSSGEITPDMWMFSRYLWGRIFQQWEPRLILTIGYEAYHFAGAFFGFHYRALPENPSDAGKTPGNRWMRFEKNGKAQITLAGFPHFSRYPAFPQTYDHNSPACAFLREVCASGLKKQP